ncbi:MAG: lysophospholipid acyltransferase family protein [Calditrichaeota bacterium]|nr:lysophospholipid acyltransferase family protein [Calditrichota bacterium]
MLACKLGWLLILAMGHLTRVRAVGRQNWERALSSGRGVLVMVWHGRILLPIYLHRRQGIIPMVSLHEDGEMIARTVERLGYRTIRGSSTRGGREAFHQMLAALSEGAICAIMPDGPRGPRHHLKPGAIRLAHRSGAYLLPVTFSCDRPIFARSWDKFMLWRPFARSVIFYGEPFAVPAHLSEPELEELRQKVEQQMIAFERQADEYVRH